MTNDHRNKRRIRINLIVLFLVSFILLTLLTGKYNSHTDGLTRIGIPFVFLQDTSGKCYDCGEIIWFKLHYLIADLMIFAMITYVLFSLYKWLMIRRW